MLMTFLGTSESETLQFQERSEFSHRRRCKRRTFWALLHPALLSMHDDCTLPLSKCLCDTLQLPDLVPGDTGNIREKQ